ncbi:MAG: TonB-dependent receptor [Cytophagales bacterium]|nr:TonB-dependent receptor [Cytophagales bacterium]
MKKQFIFLWALLWSIWTIAQDRDSVYRDPVIWLNEILVEEVTYPDQGLGYQTHRLTSKELRTNEGVSFTELLSRQAPGSIRTYGASGLATANFRGTGSSHTAVLWNGISLESPSNGTTDLSQITSGLLDNVAIQFGGSAGTFGSGAIGGTLHLNNQPNLDSGYQITASLLAGSFGRQYQHYKAEYATKNHFWSFSWFDEHADNDFIFNNTARRGAPEEKWEHAAIDRQGFLASYIYRPRSSQLKLLWWHQDNHLEIPNPATVSAPGEATQQDLSDRVLLSWDKKQKHQTFKINTALISNQLLYEDPGALLISETDFYNWHNEIQGNFSSGQVNLKSSISHRYEWVTSTGFSGGQSANRHRTSAHVSLQQNIPDLFKYTFDIRQERVGNLWAPIIPSLVLIKAFQPNLVINANASRVYRVPTFNDLFWNGPGGEGNPDLRAERGWSWEIGGDWEMIPNQDRLNVSLSLFSSHINDWILWAPITASIWSPDNIKEVWSRGAQVQIRSTLLRSELWEVRVNGSYQYTRSTNEIINEFGNTQELDQQLIYTPIHQGGASLITRWTDIEVLYQMNFVGEQFTTGDNNPFLSIDPYWITNMRISYEGTLNKIHGSVRLELNNLLDQHYFARAGYPMPGFHINLGLNLKLSQHATNF